MTDTPPAGMVDPDSTSVSIEVTVAPEAGTRPSWRSSDPRFVATLAVTALVGVALRVAVAVISRWDVPLRQDDPAYYVRQGRLISQGQWFIDPFAHLYTNGRVVTPSAQHPPVFTLLLAAADALGLHSVNSMRVVSCCIGGVGIVVVGLLGREIGNRRVGMIAAGIAAVYPIWMLSDALIQVEVAYLPIVAGTLLLAYRLWDRPSTGRAAALGLVGALATLTRSEGILLLVLVAGSVVFVRPRLAGTQRVKLLAVTLLVAAATISPWIAYNQSRFASSTFLSTNQGATLADANCPATYSGRELGSFVFHCHVPAVDETGDESERARNLVSAGVHYARDHVTRLPVVVAARVGRVWGLFRPVDTIATDPFGRWSRPTAEFMLAGYWIVLVGGLVGFVVLRRRRVPISPLVAAIAAVTVTAAVTYGIVRFRVPGDVVFITLAAVTIDALISRDLPARARTEPTEDRAPT